MKQNNCSQNDFVIAMAYVPWQQFRNLHTPANGLKHGTIFQELYKPFLGGACRR
ncbi:MAG: spore coat associated protein CotJA [Lachnospiraceae bacterium]|nr:spore coat associated protein CotJA [Lachnospira sp.]MBR6698382.1 spore coat associated protein CotJA [Lachnospiraceae bacterium]